MLISGGLFCFCYNGVVKMSQQETLEALRKAYTLEFETVCLLAFTLNRNSSDCLISHFITLQVMYIYLSIAISMQNICYNCLLVLPHSSKCGAGKG